MLEWFAWLDFGWVMVFIAFAIFLGLFGYLAYKEIKDEDEDWYWSL